MSLSSWQLYVIVDRQACGARSLAAIAEAAIQGGADVIQLRDKASSDFALAKAAEELLGLTRPAGIPLIVNDRVGVAKTVDADGVHVGQDDWPIARVREVVGGNFIVGKSTHTPEQAMAAYQEGADYIGFGPIFSTPTKPDYPSIGTAAIRQVTAQVGIPVVCIGGIDLANVDTVLAEGARCVAVVRAVCCAEDPKKAAASLKQRLAQFDRLTWACGL